MEVRELLEVISVVGGRVTLGELVRYAYRPVDDLTAAIEPLVRAGLLVEVESGRNPGYELASPQLGETLRDRLPEARRLELHRHVGRTLLVSGRVAEAAEHFARSATPGDGEAIAVLHEALALAEDDGAEAAALRLLGHLSELIPAPVSAGN